MTNEELVQAIQDGERDRMLELWQQVEQFVMKKAHLALRRMNGHCGVEFDDLYQSGYLALVKAVNSYKPDRGAKFISWLDMYLKTAFADAGGYHSRKKNTLNDADSLDALIGKDKDGNLYDTIVDPHNWCEEVEDRIYWEQVRDVLEEAISVLPVKTGTVIRAYYLEQSTRIRAKRAQKCLDQLRRMVQTSQMFQKLYVI
ncbi:MAG: sigma-70 family RNA polymerase sigma factor [Oscillospiraceae bacterium]|jgi:RNA polymerase sigma factor (sigma-70 family)